MIGKAPFALTVTVVACNNERSLEVVIPLDMVAYDFGYLASYGQHLVLRRADLDSAPWVKAQLRPARLDATLTTR